MLTLGFLSRLFGRRKADELTPGVRGKAGTDVVRTPLICPECKRQIAGSTPDTGIAVCECGGRFLIRNFEPRPLPKDVDVDDLMK